MFIRITKQFSFEMAHALWGYDGPCRHIHGHSYELFITLLGKPALPQSGPKQGMVIDFSVLKALVKELIIDKYDHALALNKAHAQFFSPPDHNRIIWCDYQPTCENLLIEIVSLLQHHIPQQFKLVYVKLHETKTSYAEWHASDNE